MGHWKFHCIIQNATCFREAQQIRNPIWPTSITIGRFIEPRWPTSKPFLKLIPMLVAVTHKLPDLYAKCFLVTSPLSLFSLQSHHPDLLWSTLDRSPPSPHHQAALFPTIAAPSSCDEPFARPIHLIPIFSHCATQFSDTKLGASIMPPPKFYNHRHPKKIDHLNVLHRTEVVLLLTARFPPLRSSSIPLFPSHIIALSSSCQLAFH